MSRDSNSFSHHAAYLLNFRHSQVNLYDDFPHDFGMYMEPMEFMLMPVNALAIRGAITTREASTAGIFGQHPEATYKTGSWHY